MKTENGKLKKYKLGELMEVTRGMSLCGDYYATEGNLMRLTLGNFDYRNNCFKDDKSKDNLYFSGDVKTEFILNEGDIITPLTEQAIGLLGSTAKVPCSGKYIQSQDVGLIKCNDKLNPDYAFYLIPSKLVRTQLSAAAQQTKIRHTSPDKIKNCTVWIPDYSTQEKFGKLLSALDDKISLNRRMNAKLEAMAKRLYDYWFIQFDFPNENGKPYKTSGGKMEYNEVLKREIPAGWKVNTLGDICNFPMDRISEKDIANKRYVPIEVIPRNEMSFSETANIEKAASGLCSFDKRSILLSNRRVYFHKVCIAPFEGITRDTVIIINPKDLNNLGFIYQIVNSKHFIDYATLNSYGSEQPVLSTPTVQEYKFVNPNNDIDKIYSKRVDGIINKVLENNLEIQKLTTLRDNLLPMLMNGQVIIQ